MSTTVVELLTPDTVIVEVAPDTVDVVEQSAATIDVIEIASDPGMSELALYQTWLFIDGGTPASRYPEGLVLDGGKP